MSYDLEAIEDWANSDLSVWESNPHKAYTGIPSAQLLAMIDDIRKLRACVVSADRMEDATDEDERARIAIEYLAARADLGDLP